jgi:hypothetical protein
MNPIARWQWELADLREAMSEWMWATVDLELDGAVTMVISASASIDLIDGPDRPYGHTDHAHDLALDWQVQDSLGDSVWHSLAWGEVNSVMRKEVRRISSPIGTLAKLAVIARPNTFSVYEGGSRDATRTVCNNPDCKVDHTRLTGRDARVTIAVRSI